MRIKLPVAECVANDMTLADSIYHAAQSKVRFRVPLNGMGAAQGRLRHARLETVYPGPKVGHKRRQAASMEIVYELSLQGRSTKIVKMVRSLPVDRIVHPGDCHRRCAPAGSASMERGNFGDPPKELQSL